VGWLGAIIAIGVLIVVHESGHFIVARLCKMRVDKFSIGFGPGIWKWTRNDTQFQIAPIPFGGYVQINGMLVAEEVDEHDPHSYPNRPVWQRFVTIFAGPATNYLFAIFLALILYSVAGIPTGTAQYEVIGTEQGFDAQGKLLPGDRLLEVNGKELYASLNGEPQEGLSEIVQRHKDEPLQIVVARDGKRVGPIAVNAKPNPERPNEDGTPSYFLGVTLSPVPGSILVAHPQPGRTDVGVVAAVGHALWYPVDQTREIVGGLYKVIRGQEKGELTGPVGITTVIRDSIKAGWITVFELLMILNVYLGLFNLFPLPALDGGRLVFLTYEMATRKRANPKIEATVHMVGIMALLVIMVLVTYKDIARLL
jgi:regulator of sigma E protease